MFWGRGGGGRCVSPLFLGFFIVDGGEYEKHCTYNVWSRVQRFMFIPFMFIPFMFIPFMFIPFMFIPFMFIPFMLIPFMFIPFLNHIILLTNFSRVSEQLWRIISANTIHFICVSYVLGPQFKPSSCLYINIFTVSVMLLCIFPCVGLVMDKLC
jgi:hypothetical protein